MDVVKGKQASVVNLKQSYDSSDKVLYGKSGNDMSIFFLIDTFC